MSLRISDMGYTSLILLFEMMAVIGQKSRNFRTFILSRTSLTQPLYPVERVNHDLYTRSEGLIFNDLGSDTMLNSGLLWASNSKPISN